MINDANTHPINDPANLLSSQRQPEDDVITYDELKSLLEGNLIDGKHSTLIDVRTSSEFASGAIPYSQNLPVADLETSLYLSPSEFLAVRGFPKPEKNMTVILTCRSGRRVRIAWDLFRTAGYERLRCYLGSWNEWEAKDG